MSALALLSATDLARRQGGFNAGYVALMLGVMTTGLAIGGGSLLQMGKDSTTVRQANQVEQDMRTAARYLANQATDNGTSFVPLAAVAGEMPNGLPIARKDPYGRAYSYCLPTNPATANNDAALAIISGGANKSVTTSCAQALAASPAGDDKVVMLTKADIASARNAATGGGGSGTALDASSQITVGKVTIGAPVATGDANTLLNVEKDVLVGGVVGAGTVSSSGNVSAGGQLGGSTLAVASDGNVGGDLGVTGNITAGNISGVNITASALLTTNNLTVNGSITGPLSVSGTVTSSGIVTGTQLKSTVTTGTAPLIVASTTVVPNLNADLLDGQTGSWYQTATNLTSGTLPVGRLPVFNGDVTVVANTGLNTMGVTVAKLQGRAVANTAPATGNILAWSGTQWAPANSSIGSLGAAGSYCTANASGKIDCNTSVPTATLTGVLTASRVTGAMTGVTYLASTGATQVDVAGGYNERYSTSSCAAPASSSIALGGTGYVGNVHCLDASSSAAVALPSASGTININQTVIVKGGTGTLTFAATGGTLRWAGGVTPTMPAAGKLAIYNFTSVLGGDYAGAKVWSE